MALNNIFRCTDTNQFIEYHKINSVLFFANDNKIYAMTGCLSKCDKYVYDIQSEGAPDKNDDDDENTLTIRLTIYSGEYEEREQVHKMNNLRYCKMFMSIFLQYIVYDSNAFIADAGGYLGLLLGQSIFGFYEIVTKWIEHNGNLCRGKQ